jgi:hypothetical protein
MKRPIDYLLAVKAEDAIGMVLFVVMMFWLWFLVARIIEACGGAW